MNGKFLKAVTVLLTLIMVMTLLNGCSGDTSEKNETTASDALKGGDDDKSASNQDNTETTEAQKSGPEELTLPIVDRPLTLTYYCQEGAQVSAYAEDYNQTRLFQFLEEKTGIHIEFLHPPSGQSQEQFELMVAANDLTDLIKYDWNKYPGGTVKAYEDGVIIRLNDEIEKYGPNLTRFYTEKPYIAKELKNDNGDMFVFGRVAEESIPFYGPMIRKDWLDTVGLEIPETVDEWYTVLKAFKEQDPNGNGEADEIPFGTHNIDKNLVYKNITGNAGFIISAFGLTVTPGTTGLCLKDGEEVAFTPIQPEFKEYLQIISKWYEEGLIEPDFAVVDAKTFLAKLNANQTGSCNRWNSIIDSTTNLLKQNGVADARLIGINNPGLNKGEIPPVKTCVALVHAESTGISSKCKNVKEAVKYMDYMFSDEVKDVYNYGFEGETYNIVNGEPEYTDLILKNPDGMSIFQALGQYTGQMHFVPGIFTKFAFMKRMTCEDEKQAIKTWDKPEDKLSYPRSIAYTVDEAERVAEIEIDMTTYLNEMITKFIMGMEPLDKFDEYVDTLKGLGVDEYVEIHKAAYDRYLKR